MFKNQLNEPRQSLSWYILTYLIIHIVSLNYFCTVSGHLDYLFFGTKKNCPFVLHQAVKGFQNRPSNVVVSLTRTDSRTTKVFTSEWPHPSATIEF